MRLFVKLTVGLALAVGWIGIAGCQENHREGVAVAPDGGYYENDYYYGGPDYYGYYDGPGYYGYGYDHDRFRRGEEFREHHGEFDRGRGSEHREGFEHHGGRDGHGGFERGGAGHSGSFGHSGGGGGGHAGGGGGGGGGHGGGGGGHH